MNNSKINRWVPQHWDDYELIDCGRGQKLERFGQVVLIRPESSAIWSPKVSKKQWQTKAHAIFESTHKTSGVWKTLNSFPSKWIISYGGKGMNLKFNLETTKFKHVGIFPEQADNWEFISNNLTSGSKVLNLFAYTGGASLAAKSADADVIHVDSIKQVVSWSRTNMEASGLDNIRWVIEDALKFITREANRGNQYDGLIMDPPSWGLGPKGERWRLEDKLGELLRNAAKVLKPDGFMVLNTYSGVSPSSLQNLMNEFFPNRVTEVGELCLESSHGDFITTGTVARILRK